MIPTELQISHLDLWIDDVPRSGPENMAIDEWLLETTDRAVLRVYRWEEGWGSLGCFCELSEAQTIDSSIRWVRRYTGGGIVDHRRDWTYTLVIPLFESIAGLRGAESYRLIHEALNIALSDRLNHLVGSEEASKLGGFCFENPVAYDIVSSDGSKIAGAGQRRTKRGLLHQGSVSGKCCEADSIERSNRLARLLSISFSRVEIFPPTSFVVEKVSSKYLNARWTGRR